MAKKEKIIIYTDGGSRGNPGLAGAGAFITNEKGEAIKRVSKFLGTVTNNEAEYQAVILGLETAKRILGKDKIKNLEIEIRMDSQLVASQLSGDYQLREEKLFPLFIKIWNLQVSDLPKLKFTYIPREKNREADKLANEAMDEGTKQQSSIF